VRDATDLTNQPLTAGNHSQGPAWFLDGRRIAFQTNDYDSPDIWSVDLDGVRRWWTRDLRRDLQPTVGPADTIVFIHQPNGVGPRYLYRVAEPQGQTSRLSDLRNPTDVDFSPDLRRLVVAQKGGRLYTMSRDGDDRRKLTLRGMSVATDPDWVTSVHLPVP
jgi:Tol biopolymer transport system component